MKLSKENSKGTEILQKDSEEGGKLREKSIPIEISAIDSEKIKTIIDKMKETLSKEGNGVALAGPQIGVLKRIFVVDPIVYQSFNDPDNPTEITPDLKSGPTETVFINPKIIKISNDKKKVQEGCLSVMPWYGTVKRASRATVKALNEKGEEFEIEGSGLLAQIFQHEIEHLDGILFTDKAIDLHKLGETE